MNTTTRILTATALASAVAFAAGMPVAMAPAKAAEIDGPKVFWRFSVWGKRRAFTEGMEYVSAAVKEKTGGKFQIKLYYGDQLSKNKENLDGISIGAFESAMFCAAYHPGKNKPLNVLDLPFLPLDDYDVMKAVHEAVYQHPASQKALAKWNAKIYMSNLLPQYEFLGRGKPPRTIDDFKGMRVRALGGMAEAMRQVGAVPTTVPAPETYTGIQRGTMDAISFPFTYSFVAYKIHEVADWYTTNMSFGTVNCPTVFNKQAWDKLPPQYQGLLIGLKDMAYRKQIDGYKAADAKNLPMFAKTMKAVTFSEEDLAKFRKIAGKPVWEKWVKDNEGEIPARELLNLVLDTAKKVKAEKAKMMKK